MSTKADNKPGNKPTGIQAYKNNKLANDIANIHQALVVDVEVKQILEATFVQEILPILTGEVVSAEFPLLMAAVAGTPFSEVDVINEAGEVIFRMPALLERNIISHVEAEKRGSMSSMLITAEMLAKQSPARAQKYLEHEFNGRGIAANRDEIIQARQQRWTDILARYNKTLVGSTGQVTAVTAATANKDKPQLDFDDDGLL
jgi:hypothetical protein